MTDLLTTTTIPQEVDYQNTVIVGVSIGVTVLLIIALVVMWRTCCKGHNDADKYSDHYSTTGKHSDEKSLKPLPNTTGNTPPVPTITLTKDEVTRSNSDPKYSLYPMKVNESVNANHTPIKVSPNTNEISLSESSINGSAFQDSSQAYRQHQVNMFRQGIKNTELINSGGVIEANHKYISRVIMPSNSSLYSRPVSRTSSVLRPHRNLRISSETLDEMSEVGSEQRQITRRNTERVGPDSTLEAKHIKISRRNTERINTGRTIEAEHTYITRVGVPVSGYYSRPTSRTNSLKRPVHLILYPAELLSRKQSWYRHDEYLSRTRTPISRSRSLGFQL